MAVLTATFAVSMATVTTATATAAPSTNGRNMAKAILGTKLVTPNPTAGWDEGYLQLQAWANGTVRSHVINGVRRECAIGEGLLAGLHQAVVVERLAIMINSLNRWCNNNTSVGVGDKSHHFINQGVGAIDVGQVNGTGSTGGTSNDVKFLRAFAAGAAAYSKPADVTLGQVNCRTTLASLPSGVKQINDTCNHVHVYSASQGDGGGRTPVTGGGSSGGSGGSGSGGSSGGASTPTAGSPVGVFEGATARLGGAVDIGGWAYDPDAPKQPVDIHVYVGGPAGVGIGHNLGPAKLSRPDVGNAYPSAGPNHGFTRTITGVPAGKQTIYVYAINIGAGTNVLIGTKDVTIATGSPFGIIDGATAARNGTAQLDGWAIDPDDPKQPVDIHVYVDGPIGVAKVGHNLQAAGLSRPDVAAAHPGAGDKHGFSTKISGLSPGKHTLYFYAINRGPGANTLLGTREVVVQVELPFGFLDVGEGRYMGEAYVAGWAIDPESPKFQADVHVYLDGPAGSGAQAFNLSGATLSRPDVEAVHPGRGKNHGFDRVLTGLSAGKHTLYVYAIGAAGSRLLASKQITVGKKLVGAGGAAVPTSRLDAGKSLKPGQALLSPKRQYALSMQLDGNLVLNHLTGVVWHTSTMQAGSQASMQNDGNLVIYNTAAKPLWATMTNGNAGASLTLQDDGNLVIYKSGTALWHRHLPGVRLQ